MMETKFTHLPFCILLLLLNSSLPFTHADHDHQHQDSAMDFLKPLVGTLKGNSTLGISKLKNFLSNLGHLNTKSETSTPHNDVFDNSLEQAIINYQSFFKLPSTRVLDAATLAQMGQPRCGVPDISPPNKTIQYTFFPGSPKWPAEKRHLTYSFPPGTRTDAHDAIRDATNLWAGVSPFTFEYTDDYNKADIKISFQVRAHGDKQAFDGKGGILAHARAPTGGVLHFDGDETWVDGVVGGAFDLQTVGLHELGHILGLGHSKNGGAIMFPSIGNGFRKGLGKDDIDGIKKLYSS